MQNAQIVKIANGAMFTVAYLCESFVPACDIVWATPPVQGLHFPDAAQCPSFVYVCEHMCGNMTLGAFCQTEVVSQGRALLSVEGKVDGAT